MPREQVRGVIAHELAHIRNRDVLVTTIAAMIGGRDLGDRELPAVPVALRWRRRRREPARPRRHDRGDHRRADRGDAHPARGLAAARVPRRPDRGRAARRGTPARGRARHAAARRRGAADGRSTRRRRRSTSRTRSSGAGAGWARSSRRTRRSPCGSSGSAPSTRSAASTTDASVTRAPSPGSERVRREEASGRSANVVAWPRRRRPSTAASTTRSRGPRPTCPSASARSTSTGSTRTSASSSRSWSRRCSTATSRRAATCSIRSPGSGTTLVQSLESGRDATGIDVAGFNCLLMRVKTRRHNLDAVRRDLLWAHEQASAFEPDVATRTTRSALRRATGSRRGRRPSCSTSARSSIEVGVGRRAPRRPRPRRSLRAAHDPLRPRLPARAAARAVLVPQAPARRASRSRRRAGSCCATRSTRSTGSRAFAAVRAHEAHASVVHGDARELDLAGPFDAIVTSPPYPGLIDYHEQHRYAYELLGPRASGTRPSSGDRRAASVGRRSARTSTASPTCSRTRGDGSRRTRRCASSSTTGVTSTRRSSRARGLRLDERLERHVNRRTGRRAGRVLRVGARLPRRPERDRPFRILTSLVHARCRCPRTGGHMHRLIRHRPLPAMVVACLALLVALDRHERRGRPGARAELGRHTRSSAPSAVTNPKLRNERGHRREGRQPIAAPRPTSPPARCPAGPAGPRRAGRSRRAPPAPPGTIGPITRPPGERRRARRRRPQNSAYDTRDSVRELQCRTRRRSPRARAGATTPPTASSGRSVSTPVPDGHQRHRLPRDGRERQRQLEHVHALRPLLRGLTPRVDVAAGPRRSRPVAARSRHEVGALRVTGAPYRREVLGSAVTFALVGLEPRRVEVEAHLRSGEQPSFAIVGLADRACQEAKHRVRSGVHSALLEWPRNGDHGQPRAGRAPQGGNRIRPCDRADGARGLGAAPARSARGARLHRRARPRRADQAGRRDDRGRRGRRARGSRRASSAPPRPRTRRRSPGIEAVGVRHLAEAVAYLRGEERDRARVAATTCRRPRAAAGSRRRARAGAWPPRARARGRRDAQPPPRRPARDGEDDARATPPVDPAAAPPRGVARSDPHPLGRGDARAGRRSRLRAAVPRAAPRRLAGSGDRRRRRARARAR